MKASDILYHIDRIKTLKDLKEVMYAISLVNVIGFYTKDQLIDMAFNKYEEVK